MNGALLKSDIISGLLTFWKILWRVGLFFLVWGLLLVPFLVPFTSALVKWKQTSPLEARLYGDIVILLTVLLTTWLMTRFLDRRPFLTIGLFLNHILKYLLVGLAIGTTWLGVSVCIAWGLGWAFPIPPSGFTWLVLAGTAISVLLNVIAQELLLCGFIFQTIRCQSNTVIAIIVSAILFSGYHAGAFKGDWLPVINVFAAGLLFCLAYIIAGNLWFPISIHFAWNLLIGPVLGLTESGKSYLGGGWKMIVVNGPPLFTGGTFGLEGGLIVTLTVSVIIILMYLFQRQKIQLLL
jgi:membrane protease YdiL (CAAX protease family)